MKLCGRYKNYLLNSLPIFELCQGAQFFEPAVSSYDGEYIIFASLPVEIFLQPLPAAIF